MANKPTAPEVFPLLAAVRKRAGDACCLHAVLDDGNVGDENVRPRIDKAKKHRHEDYVELAEKLILMSKTQQGKLDKIA